MGKNRTMRITRPLITLIVIAAVDIALVAIFLGVVIHNQANVTTVSTTTIIESGNALAQENFTAEMNSTWFGCTQNSDCTLVRTTYCDNGEPSQFTCINNASYPEYSQAFNSFIENYSGGRFCPLFIVDIPKSCECMQGTCVEVSGYQNGTNSNSSNT